MFGLGATEIILIFLAILLFFGAKRLPELAQGLGKGIREFKKAMKETEDEVKGSMKTEPPEKDSTPRPDASSRKDIPPTTH